MRLANLALAIGFTVLSIGHAAEPRMETVKFSYGITKIDLTGQGQNAMLVLGRRENFNAHGFDVLTIYVVARALPTDRSIWHLVPVFRDEKERLELTASGGADCLLHDFRLLKTPTKDGVRLIVAARELGQSYAEENNVTFEYYVLKKNSEGIAGRPLYYFEKSGSSKAKRKYCDVTAAFKEEFGLNEYMSRGN